MVTLVTFGLILTLGRREDGEAAVVHEDVFVGVFVLAELSTTAEAREAKIKVLERPDLVSFVWSSFYLI